MRLYSFVNFYLSPLQHGLQTAHCVSEMTTVYAPDSPEIARWIEWAEDHKTIIICNGGNSATLAELYEKLTRLCSHFHFPAVAFNEDEQSLNGALTSVATILPSWVYDSTHVVADSPFDRREFYRYNDNEGRIVQFEIGSPAYELIHIVKSHRLA